MKKNIDYQELYEQFEERCHEILDKCVHKIERNGLYNPIETVIHNICFPSRYIAPHEKRLVNDFNTLKKELTDPALNKRLLKNGVVEFISSLVWYRREKLITLRCISEETNYKNYIKLVIMLYEAGRQRYLSEEQKEILETMAAIMWKYLSSDREKNDEGLTPEEAREFCLQAEKLDITDLNYEQKELNNGKIIYNAYPIVTRQVLQKCFEGYCSSRNSIRGLVGIFLEEDKDTIDSEARRFTEYYNNHLRNHWEKEMEGVIDIHENSKVPITRTSNIELLYFASLNDKLFENELLGKNRKKFATDFIRKVFGSDLSMMLCIEQAQIFLSLYGGFRISPELQNHADYKMLTDIASYLAMPIMNDEREVYISNPIVEQWIYTCVISDRLYRIVEKGKKLSESKKNYVLDYASKLDGMYPFQIKLSYFQNEEKFVASSSENPYLNGHVYVAKNSWLYQQKQILRCCVNRTIEEFTQKCKKISKDTGEAIDKIILEMVDGNFGDEHKEEYIALHAEKNIKTVINYMRGLYYKDGK